MPKTNKRPRKRPSAPPYAMSHPIESPDQRTPDFNKRPNRLRTHAGHVSHGLATVNDAYSSHQSPTQSPALASDVYSLPRHLDSSRQSPSNPDAAVDHTCSRRHLSSSHQSHSNSHASVGDTYSCHHHLYSSHHSPSNPHALVDDTYSDPHHPSNDQAKHNGREVVNYFNETKDYEFKVRGLVSFEAEVISKTGTLFNIEPETRDAVVSKVRAITSRFIQSWSRLRIPGMRSVARLRFCLKKGEGTVGSRKEYIFALLENLGSGAVGRVRGILVMRTDYHHQSATATLVFAEIGLGYDMLSAVKSLSPVPHAAFLEWEVL